MGRSAAALHPTHFVPNVAFGMRAQRSTFYMLRQLLRNMAHSWQEVRRFKPDIVVSTGAGFTFAALLFAKLLGARVIYIESIARVDGASLAGKMLRWWCDHILVQWPQLQKDYPQALYCPTLREGSIDSNDTRQGIFVTIGTVMEFDRLLGAVLALKNSGDITEPIIAQTGPTQLTLPGIKTWRELSYADMQKHFRSSDIVITHGGSGSILGALEAGCRVVAVARRQRHGDHYDDHQLDILKAFERAGLIEAAYDTDEVAAALTRARQRRRRSVLFDPTTLIAALDKIILPLL